MQERLARIEQLFTRDKLRTAEVLTTTTTHSSRPMTATTIGDLICHVSIFVVSAVSGTTTVLQSLQPTEGVQTPTAALMASEFAGMPGVVGTTR